MESTVTGTSVILTGKPTTSMKNQSQLDAIGLTEDVLQKIYNGEITQVSIQQKTTTASGTTTSVDQYDVTFSYDNPSLKDIYLQQIKATNGDGDGTSRNTYKLEYTVSTGKWAVTKNDKALANYGDVPHSAAITRLPAQNDNWMTVHNLGITPAVVGAAADGKIVYLRNTSTKELYVVEYAAKYSDYSYSIRFLKRSESDYYIYSVVSSGNQSSHNISVSITQMFPPAVATLTSLPTAEITTLTDLSACGLTTGVRESILEDKTTYALEVNGDMYNIIYTSGTVMSGTIKFARYYIDSGAVKGAEYDVTVDAMQMQEVTVTVKEA